MARPRASDHDDKRAALLAKAAELFASQGYDRTSMIEIARALGGQPSLLLLDEPAAGLNASEKVGLRELLQRIARQGPTILLVEHDMTLVAEVAQQITVLNFGRCIADGTPAHVLALPDVITAYLGSELDASALP